MNSVSGRLIRGGLCSLFGHISLFTYVCQLNIVFLDVFLKCRLDGYCNAEKRIICLHLQSFYDSMVLADICKKAENDITLNVSLNDTSPAIICFITLSVALLMRYSVFFVSLCLTPLQIILYFIITRCV